MRLPEPSHAPPDLLVIACDRAGAPDTLVAAVNDIIDVHTIRNTAVFDKLPGVVLGLMVFITSAALAVAGFRLLTFWAWIVIGWVALGAIARRARRAAPAARAAG